MSLVINAMIGFANASTIALSGFMKVPQVYSLLKSRSPSGVSLQGLLLEFSGYCIMMSYNFYSNYPLASYFEYPLLVVQDLVMILVMMKLLNLYSSSLILHSVIFLSIMTSIGWGIMPTAFIALLVICMYSTRLFTIYVESYDVALLLNFFVSLVLNLAIIGAALKFRPTKKEHSKKTD
ncbi:PQ-loop repeat-containing protein 3 [Armadillidium nasatum]|uniref:PQ-loop repeat-containing protein 3 n=1 Tax=Armadillidium nasatum TaxID=96803 RepID=A0A5N5T1Y7_9CRUS|nr:PQ-loop repeat-containing protein 3 [Armadillidium nasatum]